MTDTQSVLDLSRSPITVHPPYGTIQLLQCTADDLSVANAARVSFGKRSEYEWENLDGERATAEGMRAATDEKWVPVLKPEDKHVVEYLMRNKHGTPFEHNQFTFLVKAPIFVFREWHRHRIGVSINEMSGRYTELRCEFYIPDDEHMRKQVGKPGKYTYEQLSTREAYMFRRKLEASYAVAWNTYQDALSAGVAKEVARLCLPVATYSEMYWTCNARSLMAFLELRNAPTAQREIKDYAEVMEQMFLEQMPVTAQAFINNGRVAP